jgi:hypothetical protein
VIDFLGMWLYLGRELQGTLADFAWRCLESAPRVTANQEYDCDVLATTLAEGDIERAFRLLDRLLTVPRAQESWRPTAPHREGGFWRFLREKDRMRAIRLVLRLAATDRNLRYGITSDLRDSIDQRADAEVLLALIQEGEAQASLVSEIISTSNPGFWPIAIEIVRRYPRNDQILALLASGIEQLGHVITGSWSEHLERCRREVASVLENPALPVAARRWLEKVEAGLQQAADRQLLAEANEEAQGLRRIVEDPTAPERLWAIRALVRSGQFDRLKPLIKQKEIRKLLPKLKLSNDEARRLRSAFGFPESRRKSKAEAEPRKRRGKTTEVKKAVGQKRQRRVSKAQHLPKRTDHRKRGRRKNAGPHQGSS